MKGGHQQKPSSWNQGFSAYGTLALSFCFSHFASSLCSVGPLCTRTAESIQLVENNLWMPRLRNPRGKNDFLSMASQTVWLALFWPRAHPCHGPVSVTGGWRCFDGSHHSLRLGSGDLGREPGVSWFTIHSSHHKEWAQGSSEKGKMWVGKQYVYLSTPLQRTAIAAML